MCGIAAILLANNAPVDIERPRRMASAMRHRGPDNISAWTHGNVGFGHARLKILDLSDAANQPFTDGADALIFNGEIFNHGDLRQDLTKRGITFSTTSDTETLFRALQVWQAEGVLRLHGQFSFVFYSHRTNSILVARDHVGICPLYMAEDALGLYIASEIRPLLAITGSRANPAAIIDFLSFRYNIENGRTLFRGVERFPAGHLEIIDLASGQRNRRRHWRLPFADEAMAPEDAQSEFARRFTSEVGRQAIADVPVGLFLSGGIDSSALLHAYSRTSSKIDAFTLRFLGTEVETRKVAALQERYGFRPHSVELKEPFEVPLEETVRALEEPFGDLIICANHALAAAASQKLTVALSGEGGDEAFFGYDHQRAFAKFLRLSGFGLSRLVGFGLSNAPPRLLEALASYPGKFGADEIDRLRRINARLASPADAYLETMRLFDEDGLQDLLSRGFKQRFGHQPDVAPITRIFEEEKKPWRAALRAEIEQATLIVNLIKQDRLCMSHSLEARVPLVAKPILELTASLSEKTLLSREPKALLQRYVNQPPQGKRPFSMFENLSYLRFLQSEFDRVVTDDCVAELGVFNPDAISRIRSALPSGTMLAVKKAMAVLIFTVWSKVFNARI